MQDLVTGLIKLMQHPSFTDPVNIGTEDEATVLEWATMIRDKVEQMRDRGEIPLSVGSSRTAEDDAGGLAGDMVVFEQRKRARRSEIVLAQAVVDDPPRRRPDITRAKEVLGWQPSYSLEAGIEETIR